MRKQLLIYAVVILCGIGGYAYWKIFGSTPSVDRAVELVPANAIAYANVFINPSNDQKRALRDLIAKFPQFENTDDATGRLFELIDEQLAQVDLSFDQDVKPWLGKQVAIYVSPDAADDGAPEIGFLLAAKDEAEARATVDRAVANADLSTTEDGDITVVDEGEDPFAYSTADSFLLGGTEPAVQAMLDDSKESLADSEKYADALDGLPYDHVGSFFLDGRSLFRELVADGQIQPDDADIWPQIPGLAGSLAATVTLAPEHVALDVSGSIPRGVAITPVIHALGEEVSGIDDLPSSAWLAAESPGIKQVVRYVGLFAPDFARFDSDVENNFGVGVYDATGWAGDTRFFLRGEGVLDAGAAVLAESTDPDETARQVDAVAQKLEGQGVTVRDATRDQLDGFTAQIGLPLMVLGGDGFVAAIGGLAANEAVSPEATLSEQRDFVTAENQLGDNYDPRLYIDARRAIHFGESVAQTAPGGLDPFYVGQVKPYLDHLSHAILGLHVEGDRLFLKLVAGVR